MGNGDLREAANNWLEEPEGAPGNCEECCKPATTTVLDHLMGVIFLCDECAPKPEPCPGCGAPIDCECVEDDDGES